MNRALALCLGTALCAAPLAFTAATAADKPAVTKAVAPKGAYKAPKNEFGQPDLGDVWSNATLTPEIGAPVSEEVIVPVTVP